MNAVNALQNAALGWLDLLSNRQSETQRFDPTRAGLITALFYYFIVVAGLTLIDLLVPGIMTYDRFFVGLILNSLPLAGVALVTAVTMRFLKPETSMNVLLVPAIYALTFQILLGVILSSFLGDLVGYTLLGILGYMLYRGARDLTQLSLGVSAAYAALCLIALVGPIQALHMLFLPPPV